MTRPRLTALFTLAPAALLFAAAAVPVAALGRADAPAAWTLAADDPALSGGDAAASQLPAGSVHALTPTAAPLAAGQGLSLPMPDGSTLRLGPATTSSRGDVSTTLHAKASDGGYATLTTGPDGLFGRIGHASGQYMVTTDRDGSWLIRLDDPRLQVDAFSVEPVGRPADPRAHSTAGGAGPSMIDVMFTYTPDMQERYPGSLLATRLEHVVALANQGLVDSGVDAVVRLVHHEPADYTASVSIFDALDALRDGLRGLAADVFTGLDDKRVEYGADLVVLAWPHDIETRGACGVAYLPEFDESQQVWDDTLGVHVINDGISNWSVCSDAVFMHELGHNLNALHQRFAPEDPGSNYAFVVPERFNTVMGSFGSRDINRYMRLPVFSSPDIQCGGQPCGSTVAGEEADNAAAVSTLAPIVAGYAVPVSSQSAPVPPPSAPDSDGDGTDDWSDSHPFDAHDGSPPPGPGPVDYSDPPILDGSQIDHWELLIADSATDQVHAYDMQGGHRKRVLQVEPMPFPDERPSLSEFTRFDVADDGMLYMLAGGSVRRYDRARGIELDIFLDSQPPLASPGSLFSGFPRSLGFADDTIVVLGDPYIEVYGDDAAFLNVQALPDLADPKNPDFSVALRGFAIDSADRLYVVEALDRRIARFESLLGVYTDEAVTPGDPLITDPWTLAAGPGDALYLANGSGGNVLAVDPATGDVTEFVADGSGGPEFARDLAFGPDDNLYVLDRATRRVLRYDGQSGAFMDVFVDDAPRLQAPESMHFARQLDLQVFRDRFEPVK